ncbi:MAG: AAA family ATPase [Deltaproteobacteria bacterium]|nr:AAA family ATPase [Deltaproteobacteria bacterium]
MDDIFVGRERELQVLRTAFADADAGRGRLVLLTGEPGIGKTRLASELATSAYLHGVQVFISRCYEGEGAPPFWPWVQIVRAAISARDPQTLRAEMEAGAAAIAQVVPEVQERLPDLPSLPVLEPEQARFRFFDSVTTFLKNAATPQPVVLILDDLHAADTSSLLLLQFVVRELEHARVLLVGTYRDVSLSAQHPLAPLLGELARERNTQTLLLRGLSQHEVARFVEHALGQPPSEPLITAVYTQTEGNPFFVTEVVRLLTTAEDQTALAQPSAAALTVPLPQQVREAVRHRLQMLSEECRDLLTIAAVIGREFALRPVEAVAAECHASLRGPVLAVLDEAITARLIATLPSSIGRYIFSHALIREALYESLSTVERVQLHAQVGTALEHLYGADAGIHLADLAHHYFEGARGGEHVDKAIAYATRAGEHALATLAYEEAVIQYERALQLLDLKDADEAQRCELLLALGGAQRQASTIRQARDTFLRAAAIARARRLPHQLARAALGFAGLWVTAVGVVDTPAISLLEESLRALGEEKGALRARVLARLGVELWFSGSQERRAALSQEAVALARQVGDPKTLAYTLHARHLILWEPATLAQRLTIASEILRLAEESGDRELTMEGHSWRIKDLSEFGDIPALDAEIAAYARLAEELRQPTYQHRVATWKGMRALLEGQFQEGEQLAQQAFALGQKAQRSQDATLVFGIQIFVLRREQGGLEDLEPAIRASAEQYPAFPIVRYWLACLYSELGRTAEAGREFERLAEHDFADLPQDISWLLALAFLSQACTFLGDTGRAARLYALLLPCAGHNVVYGSALAYHDTVSHLLGLLATTLGCWEEARAHFAAALAALGKMNARPRLAHCQYDYARMLLARRATGDREQALALLAAAHATAQTLGMQRLLEKVQAMQEQALQTVPPPQPPAVNRFCCDGKWWSLSFAGTTVTLRDVKGVRYIAYLLQRPQEEVHVLDLLAVTTPPPVTEPPTAVAELRSAQLTVQSSSGGRLGPDAAARAAYRQRLAELQEELQETQRYNDPGRAGRIQAELEFLSKELAAMYGVSKYAASQRDEVEKVRKAVTNCIRDVLAKLQKVHPALWQHLFTALKTGTFCSYCPTQPTPWMF